ncbi:hypothetical protein [Ferruginibacter sp.]|nr:hypothetical protein [Ferruginibacter sp.]
MNKHFLLLLYGVVLLFSCNSTATQNAAEPITVAEEKSIAVNYLSMKINGKEWKADSEIFGAFHPKGYNNAIIISGSKGPNDKTEQSFNINLYNTNGIGTYDLVSGNKDLNVVQLGNLSTENYLYGSVLGFSFHVNVTKASQNPATLEATFEGTLTGNAGDSIKITDGKFYYYE